MKPLAKTAASIEPIVAAYALARWNIAGKLRTPTQFRRRYQAAAIIARTWCQCCSPRCFIRDR